MKLRQIILFIPLSTLQVSLHYIGPTQKHWTHYVGPFYNEMQLLRLRVS